MFWENFTEIFGNREPNDKPKPAAKSKASPKAKSLPTTFTAEELSQKEIPPQRWIVPGYLPEGVTMLAGAPKSGKSWLALQLALAVAKGTEFANLDRCRSTGVLYLALEDSERRLQERQAVLLDGPQPEKLNYALSWNPFDQDGISDLKDWLKAHRDIGIVIVDVFALVRKQNKPGRNIYDEDYSAIRDVKELAASHGVAIVLVHHTRKGEADDVLQTVSGSTGLTAAVDAIMVLQRQQGSENAELYITGRDVENKELGLHFDSGRWSYTGPVLKKLQATRQAIVDAIADAGMPVSPKELVEPTKLKYENIKKTAQRMATDGELVSVAGGRYALVKEPASRRRLCETPKAA